MKKDYLYAAKFNFNKIDLNCWKVGISDNPSIRIKQIEGNVPLHLEKYIVWRANNFNAIIVENNIKDLLKFPALGTKLKHEWFNIQENNILDVINFFVCQESKENITAIVFSKKDIVINHISIPLFETEKEQFDLLYKKLIGEKNETISN